MARPKKAKAPQPLQRTPCVTPGDTAGSEEVPSERLSPEQRAEYLGRLWDGWLVRQVRRFEDTGADVKAAELQAVRQFLSDQGITRDALDKSALYGGGLGIDVSKLPDFTEGYRGEAQEVPEE